MSSDLSAPGLGLNPLDIAYLSRRPLKVIHCAASIRFIEERTSGEPYRTNVDGTAALLDLCQQLNVIDLHYVSTAYVGSRSGQAVVTEEWVDSESMAGNDYERSKIMAERLVRSCTGIRSRTIHRPSIVVGDSRTSYTSTFHGFYAPLQVGAAYAKEFGFSPQAGDGFRGQLGLSANDSKNIVAVDWVANAIVAVALQPPTSAARILHWTHPRPVACEVMQAAIVDAIERRYGVEARGAQRAIEEPATQVLPETFREQMGVYESYFGNDPVFDATAAKGALTQATCTVGECPPIDYQRLSELADFAIEHNFGWPKLPPRELPHRLVRETLNSMKPEGESTSLDEIEGRVTLRLTGAGAPEKLYFLRTSRSWRRVDELETGGDWEMEWTLPLAKLADCIIARTRPIVWIDAGYWLIQGSLPNEWLAIVTDWVNDVISRVKA
jgi:nucleoside-diphosphate-sugar epimerase